MIDSLVSTACFRGQSLLKRWSRFTAMALGGALLLGASSTYGLTYFLTGDNCGRVNNLGCTANDSGITTLNIVTGAPPGNKCVYGDMLNLGLSASISTASAQRYDLGLFVATDGLNPGITGAGGSTHCDVLAGDPNVAPFSNLEPGLVPADTCGDIAKNTTTTWDFSSTLIPIKCVPDAAGNVAVQAVSVYDNNVGSNCTDATDIFAGTKSKCQIFSVTTALTVLGQITVRKATTPAGGGPFGFTATGTGVACAPAADCASGFNLSDGGSQVITAPIGAGNTITITESTFPAGGWSLGSLTCTTGTASRNNNVVTVALSGTNPIVDCTFNNVQQTTGTIIVNKVISGTPTDAGLFHLQIDGITAGADGGGAGVGDGGTTGPQTVPTGTHSVGEIAGNGTSLSNYTGAINCVDQAPVASGAPARLKAFSQSGISVLAGHTVTCTITNTVIPPPDLTKLFSPTTINSGGTTVLTFTLANPATAPARSVSFVDTLPSGLRVANTTVGGSCSNALTATTVTAGGSTVTVSGLNLAAGASTCTVTVNVTNAASQTNPTCPAAAFTNSASNISGASSVSTANMVSSCVVVNSIADLGITKSESISSYQQGTSTPVIYTVVITNNGPDNLTGAQFTDTAPAGVTFGAWSCVVTGTGACPGPGTGNISATFDLNSGSHMTFTINATIGTGATGTLTNTATESLPAGVAQNPASNSPDTASVSISGTAPVADLQVTKSANIQTYTPGTSTPVTYTLVVTNFGPNNVTGATVTDTAPANVTFGAWTCSVSGTGTCPASGSGNISTTVNLNGGASATFVISATIGTGASGNITNTATEALPGNVTQDPGINRADSASAVVSAVVVQVPVPTMTQWMLTAMAGVLGLLALAYLRRRNR